jgi:hypothetical protein
LSCCVREILFLPSLSRSIWEAKEVCRPVVEHLPGLGETLGSILSTGKTNIFYGHMLIMHVSAVWFNNYTYAHNV